MSRVSDYELPSLISQMRRLEMTDAERALLICIHDHATQYGTHDGSVSVACLQTQGICRSKYGPFDTRDIRRARATLEMHSLIASAVVSGSKFYRYAVDWAKVMEYRRAVHGGLIVATAANSRDLVRQLSSTASTPVFSSTESGHEPGGEVGGEVGGGHGGESGGGHGGEPGRNPADGDLTISRRRNEGRKDESSFSHSVRSLPKLPDSLRKHIAGEASLYRRFREWYESLDTDWPETVLFGGVLALNDRLGQAASNPALKVSRPQAYFRRVIERREEDADWFDEAESRIDGLAEKQRAQQKRVAAENAQDAKEAAQRAASRAEAAQLEEEVGSLADELIRDSGRWDEIRELFPLVTHKALSLQLRAGTLTKPMRKTLLQGLAARKRKAA